MRLENLVLSLILFSTHQIGSCTKENSNNLEEWITLMDKLFTQQNIIDVEHDLKIRYDDILEIMRNNKYFRSKNYFPQDDLNKYLTNYLTAKNLLIANGNNLEHSHEDITGVISQLDLSFQFPEFDQTSFLIALDEFCKYKFKPRNTCYGLCPKEVPCFYGLYVKSQHSFISYVSLTQLKKLLPTSTVIQTYVDNNLERIKNQNWNVFGKYFSPVFDMDYSCHLSCSILGIKNPTRYDAYLAKEEVYDPIQYNFLKSYVKIVALNELEVQNISSESFCKPCTSKFNEPKTMVILLDTTDAELAVPLTFYDCDLYAETKIHFKYLNNVKLSIEHVTGGYVNHQLIICQTISPGNCYELKIVQDYNFVANYTRNIEGLIELEIDFQLISAKFPVGSDEQLVGSELIMNNVIWRINVEDQVIKIFNNSVWTEGPKLPIYPSKIPCLTKNNNTHFTVANLSDDDKGAQLWIYNIIENIWTMDLLPFDFSNPYPPYHKNVVMDVICEDNLRINNNNVLKPIFVWNYVIINDDTNVRVKSDQYGQTISETMKLPPNVTDLTHFGFDSNCYSFTCNYAIGGTSPSKTYRGIVNGKNYIDYKSMALIKKRTKVFPVLTSKLYWKFCFPKLN